MLSASPKKASRWKVPMRMWPWLSRVNTAERVGEGSSPRSSASPVSNTANVLEVLTPSASSIPVASEPDPLGPAAVAKARRALREARRLDGIVEIAAELEDLRVGAIAWHLTGPVSYTH